MLDDLPLDPAIHDRQGFECGVPALDEYLHRFADQHRRRGISSAFVLTESVQPERILGYYTLSATGVDGQRLTETERKKLPATLCAAFAWAGSLAERINRAVDWANFCWAAPSTAA